MKLSRTARRGLLSCLAAPLMAIAACGGLASPRASTEQGAVAGQWMDGGAAFRGIPFAAPPVGELRWRPPEPAPAWSGVRHAVHFGPICPQAEPRKEANMAQSEDCLTLNVFTPNPKARGLPVVFNIHGGAFMAGSGRLSNGEVAPLLKHGVIIVSPNYRLGRLGSFAHPALDHGADGKPFATYWLMDQIAALQWVRRNIARFGGDPNKVTLLGCSAGGSSVNTLVASPAARGLFARASTHSGGGLFSASRDLKDAEAQGVAFANRMGVAGDGPAAAAKLRALSVAKVLADDPGFLAYSAVVDGRLLPDKIPNIFANGRQSPTPYMAGSTSNEASVAQDIFTKAVLNDQFGVDLDRLRDAYDPERKLSEAELLRQVQTDFVFTAASVGMSQLASRSAPAWAYYFDYIRTGDRGEEPGVSHCGDMDFLLGSLDGPSAEDLAISKVYQAYFVNFVRTGDPNGPGLPAWPQMKPNASAPLVVRPRIRAEKDFRARQLAPWYQKLSAETGVRVAN